MSQSPFFNISTINTILWDWNGTLLNDVEMCVDTINVLLESRHLTKLSYSSYRDIFTFPVKDYYIKAGFDFECEAFDKVAIEFIDIYANRVRHTDIFPNVLHILGEFKKAGFRQYVVSAMEHDFLKDTMTEKGIINLLDGFSGITDHFAGSKLDMAKQFIQSHQFDREKTCLIGDTLHDFEVAESLDFPCLLVASGHQSEDRLKESGAPVFRSLDEVALFFQINHSEVNIK